METGMTMNGGTVAVGDGVVGVVGVGVSTNATAGGATTVPVPAVVPISAGGTVSAAGAAPTANGGHTAALGGDLSGLQGNAEITRLLHTIQEPDRKVAEQKIRRVLWNSGKEMMQESEEQTGDLDNTNLYVKGLWKDCTQVELDDIFKPYGVIQQSRVYGDGVGFVRYETGAQAGEAIKALNGQRLGDRCDEPLLVKHAFRKQRNPKRYIRVGRDEVEMIMNKNTNNVYLRCLPRGFGEKELTELCSPYGELTCTRLRESGVAFVRFRRAEDAAKAIRNLNGSMLATSTEPLLAKLANSDPFQPKIGFRSRKVTGGMGGDEDMSPEYTQRLMQAAQQVMNQTKGRRRGGPRRRGGGGGGGGRMRDRDGGRDRDRANGFEYSRRSGAPHMPRMHSSHGSHAHGRLSGAPAQGPRHEHRRSHHGAGGAPNGFPGTSPQGPADAYAAGYNPYDPAYQQQVAMMYGYPYGQYYYQQGYQGNPYGYQVPYPTRQGSYHSSSGTSYQYQQGYEGVSPTNTYSGSFAPQMIPPQTSGEGAGGQTPMYAVNGLVTPHQGVLKNGWGTASKEMDFGGDRRKASDAGSKLTSTHLDGTLGGPLYTPRNGVGAGSHTPNDYLPAHLVSTDNSVSNSQPYFLPSNPSNPALKQKKQEPLPDGKDGPLTPQKQIKSTTEETTPGSTGKIDSLQVPGVKVPINAGSLFGFLSPQSEVSFRSSQQSTGLLGVGSQKSHIAPLTTAPGNYLSVATPTNLLSPGTNDLLRLQSNGGITPFTPLPVTPKNLGAPTPQATGGSETPANPIDTDIKAANAAANFAKANNTGAKSAWSAAATHQDGANQAHDPKIADQVFGFVQHFYPGRAPKLTGMFLHNNNQEECRRLLVNPDALRKEIDKLAKLLENSNNTKT